MTLPIAEQWFRRETFADGVTLLTEPHVDPFARCNVWHVRGRERDLVIDTGLGICSLREAASDLLDRAVTCVLTHSHFDHIGGAYEFTSRVAHVDELAELSRPSGFGGLTARALGDELVQRLRGAGYAVPEHFLTALPSAGFLVDDYTVRSAPLTGTVLDGDLIDLGDRTFEVLHLPGHSPGSIALWEGSTKTLFSGDALYDGPLLFDLPGSSIQDYVATLRRLLELDVAVVHAGHDPSFGKERLREIAIAYLERWDA
ncbi:MAG: MBL fold metallo-hydrolase [Myxococcales bacterium]|nr:MAG: MBL fold metallo-hydrolase [Myxococcales bacterium]